MFRHIFGSRLPVARPHIVPPSRRQRVLAHRSLVCSFLLMLLLLLSQVLGNWGFLVKPAEAASAGVRPSAPASMTMQQFLKEGRNDHVYRGPVQPPSGPASTPKSTSAHTTDYAHLPPSAEPPTMSPLSHGLDASLFAGSTTAGSAPLDLVSSDKRLEVRIFPGSLDLSQATVAGGGKPSGSLTLTLTELHGHFAATMNMLGAYQLQITDAQGHLVNGLRARTPVSFIYHYQPAELTNLDLDPGRLSLSWPSLIQAARQARQPTTGFVFPMRDDPVSQTLTAPSTILGSGIFAAGVGDPQNQSPATPHFASEQGNSGQLAYAYPLQVPPGTGGFAPNLLLNYSSGNPNGRPSRFSPANNVGDGWTLSLGSITMDTYPNGSQWYFIEGIDNTADRLIANGSLYDTEHLSRLRIKQGTGAGGQPCFNVWDKAGTYYELGCTADSLQYRTDSTGTRHNYRWDVSKIVAPNEGPASTSFKLILVSYEQDKTTSGSYTTIRDAAIKQILYGTGIGSVSTVAGTVDFAYHAPSADAPWATAYGTNYNCGPTPPVTNTTLRCDDPIQYGTIQPPAVMSTLTLDTVTSYVGADSSSSNKAYGYSFTYTDTPFATNSTGGSAGGPCYDPVTLTEQYCAGEHLLSTITPTRYQNGTAHQLKQMTFGYSGPVPNNYYDSGDKNQGGGAYNAQTYWQYLTSYLDTDTGVGETITYSTANNNTHGTPTQKDSHGNIIDDRYDALFCTVHASDSYRCSGTYANPDDHAWTEQVVTSITSSGKDSSASSLSPATTTYSYYRLAKTGTGCPADQYGQDTDCVGDNWLPKGDTDWQDFFHGEFRGFAQVWTLSAAKDLTVDSYYSTEGWNTPSTDGANYNAGRLYETDSYNGSSTTTTALLSKTQTVFAGMSDWNNSATSSSCRASQATYVACEGVVVKSRTLQVEGSSTSPPWVEHDYTYDDYTNTGSGNGLSTSSTVYHNLTQEVISGSNLSTTLYPLTNKWTYTPHDGTAGSWTYYTVDAVTHSETDDHNGGVWQCQDTTYDENSGNSLPTAGLPTTSTSYSTACQSGTAIKQYQAYDANGNALATVDGVGAANPSFYSSSGCTLSSGNTIVVHSSAWTNTHYPSCANYDSIHFYALPVSTGNALGQSTSVAYATNQGDVPTSTTDLNGQTTSYNYSYDSSGNRTVQATEPLNSGAYTTQSKTNFSCTTSSTLPCYEIDTNSFQYSGAITRTFYDSMGRAVETRKPGPGASYDTIVFTVYNDQAHTSFQSVPFQVASGSSWVDPNGAKDYQGATPGGTVTFYDALNRAVAEQDPNFGSSQEPGIACSATLTSTYTACVNYSLGTASGDTNTYASATTVDANNHVATSYADALSRTVYIQDYSGLNGQTLTLNEQKSIQYNVLDKLTSVAVTDKAPQSGQSITSVTTSAQYDSLGRLTQVSDPDRGTHAYTYDADGRLLSDVVGTHTLGYNDDLLGRQDLRAEHLRHDGTRYPGQQ